MHPQSGPVKPPVRWYLTRSDGLKRPPAESAVLVLKVPTILHLFNLAKLDTRNSLHNCSCPFETSIVGITPLKSREERMRQMKQYRAGILIRPGSSPYRFGFHTAYRFLYHCQSPVGSAAGTASWAKESRRNHSSSDSTWRNWRRFVEYEGPGRSQLDGGNCLFYQPVEHRAREFGF